MFWSTFAPELALRAKTAPQVSPHNSFSSFPRPMSNKADSEEERVSGLCIVRKGSVRYIVNATEVGIDRLQYSTAALGEDYVSSVPTFEISSVPGRAGVKIEDVDRYEDGLLVWQINEVQWADGSAYEGTKKLTEKKNAPVDWARVEREKTPIGEPTPPQNLDNEGQE